MSVVRRISSSILRRAVAGEISPILHIESRSRGGYIAGTHFPAASGNQNLIRQQIAAYSSRSKPSDEAETLGPITRLHSSSSTAAADPENMREEIEELKRKCFKASSPEATDFASAWVKPSQDGLVISGASAWGRISTIVGAVRDSSGVPPESIAKPIFIRKIGRAHSNNGVACLSILDMLTFMLLKGGAKDFRIESDSLDSIRAVACPRVHVSDDQLRITLSILLILHEEKPSVTFAWVDGDCTGAAARLLQFGQRKELEEGLHEYEYEEVGI